MTDPDNLDRWRDRMVAALYGELPPDEMRELEEQMARDEALRRDWQELEQARAALQELAGSAPVEDALPLGAAPWKPVVSRPRRWLLPAAAGFAAAALVFLGLLVAGLRVDRTPAGLLVRVDGSPGAELEAAGGIAHSNAQGTVTRAEFAELAQMLMDGTAARIDQLERRQAGAQVELTQALYDALVTRQERQYDDLRTRIELARAGWPAAADHDRRSGRKGVNDGTD